MLLNSDSCFLKNLFDKGFIAILVPFFCLTFMAANAQDRLDTPVKIKVEDGNFDGVSVVVKNNTTGETNTVAGAPKLDLSLKINSDYVISFSKPGYITKRIAINTNTPVDRASQGFYPFNFEVVIFKQYDGVNIVIFNQPVGKISFNRLIDDFDYDTDYTKQIQSALKSAEDEIRKKQEESKVQAEQLRKEEEKQKAAAAQQAKLDEKARQDSVKKAAEEARILAAQEAKAKLAQEEEQKKATKVMQEEERQKALAKMEEEERAKAKAAQDAEERKKATAVQGNDDPNSSRSGVAGADTKKATPAGQGMDSPVTASASGSGSDPSKNKAGTGSGDDAMEGGKADPTKGQEKGIKKATGTSGSENLPEPTSTVSSSSTPATVTNENFEVLPDISVEEITESNRKITKVIVRKNQKETVFSKVVYHWGGVFYFRQTTSISESLYFMNTGLR